MLHFLQFLGCLSLYGLLWQAVAMPQLSRAPDDISRDDSSELVTWDEYSIMVRGERIMFFSGEMHPFRLPSPGLWLDVFQKIKAAGFTGVSFYLMWGLLEGEPGHVRTEGVFALEEFFRAASEAGLYLLARPGPYINAETSGGGFPGWIKRISGDIRSNNPNFTSAIEGYLSHVGRLIAVAQITNGGPVILVQPENEYSACQDYEDPGKITACLEPEYMALVESILRDSGITVPFITNDAVPIGNWAPGTGLGEVDLYGMDAYPASWGSGCENPGNWDRGYSPLDHLNATMFRAFSPNTPFALVEYQGGAPDFWGGVGIENCAVMINHNFSRVFNKLLYGMRVTVLNLYMIFGGTNWGNLGYSNGYTSYDVGAAISENRMITREKYQELKMQGYFLQSSPTYLTSDPDDGTVGEYTDNPNLFTSRLTGHGANYYVVRHIKHGHNESEEYSLTVASQIGKFTVPQLGGSLLLGGRDSRIHVSDYSFANFSLVYSSAEILSWRIFSSKTILLLYGGEKETHEFALPASMGCPDKVEGPEIVCQRTEALTIIHTVLRPQRQVLHFGSGLDIYVLERNEAYKYWVVDLPAPAPIGNFASPSRLASSQSSVIVKAGYLIRSAMMNGSSLYLTGDIDSTTEVEVIGGPAVPECLYFNGEAIQVRINGSRVTGMVEFKPPKAKIPALSDLSWYRVDSLPEVQAGYDDSAWTPCNLKCTNNTRPLSTPTSLYSGDYGFHSGSLLYRGHFVASGEELSLLLSTQGGAGFGHSVWLNSTFLGSWVGSGGSISQNQTLDLPETLESGASYTLTVLIDHMGLMDNWVADGQEMKEPRGILHYELRCSGEETSISWKMTGNAGAESYLDHSRGPLNEGAMFAERQGLHLPGAPFTSWDEHSPLQGLDRAGVDMFATEFHLSLPENYDIPISLKIANATSSNDVEAVELSNFRVQIYLNGWQLGKYVNNLGPQSRYPLPEGILNHQGLNYLAITLWSLDERGAKIYDISLEADAILQSGKKSVPLVEGTTFTERPRALY